MALILTIFANSRCHLVSFNAGAFEQITSSLPFAPKSFGLWCFETTDGSLYDLRDYSFDSKFDAARAMGVTTSCLGFIIVIFYIVAGCVRFSPHVFKFVGFLAILASLFQGLVFLVYKSGFCEFGCSLDTGGKCAISAIVFWFITGITSCAAGKEADEAEARRDDNPKTDAEEP